MGSRGFLMVREKRRSRGDWEMTHTAEDYFC